jgi:hypothetical protein
MATITRSMREGAKVYESEAQMMELPDLVDRPERVAVAEVLGDLAGYLVIDPHRPASWPIKLNLYESEGREQATGLRFARHGLRHGQELRKVTVRLVRLALTRRPGSPAPSDYTCGYVLDSMPVED